LIIDDVSPVIGTPAEDLLLAWLDGRKEPFGREPPDRAPGWPAGPGPHVVAGTSASEAALAFRGVLARLRAGRTGVLTGAIGPVDSEAFSVRVPPRPAGPPGRAVLIRPEGPVAIQLADPG
jgi:hypothetical protein